LSRRLLRLAPAGLLLLLGGCRPSASALVAQAVAARGGLEHLRAIRSQRLSGKISVGSVAGSLYIEFKRPNQMRMEILLPTRTVVRLFDGASGWTSNAPPGHLQFEPMSAAELSQARREADMDGPLVDSKTKGIRIELAGKGAVEGRATDQLDIIFPDGTIERYQLDAASHEPVRWDEQELIAGKRRDFAFTVRATRRVEGVLFPTTIDSGAPGSGPSQRVIIERIELNPLLDDARFRAPAVAEGPAP
jgi:hypothetical protein